MAVAQLWIVRPQDTAMRPSDYLGFGASFGFGLWWLLFPRSVIGFYTWFHGGRARIPGTFGVRLCGALLVALVFAVMVSFLLK